MAEIASAFVTIAPSAKGFGSSLSTQVSGQTASAGRTIGRTFGKMFVLGASVLAAAGIGNLLKGSIEEAREAQKVGAATEAIIKATGGAANLTANQVGNLSSALSAKIGVDDEAIQAGANLLLTFKNVRNEAGKGADVFTRATAAGADLAATGFGSIESNAKMLGKALNDPEKGLTALTRAGVQFTEGQKKQIAGFVESGNLLGAQKVILGEVEAQVGGVAAATVTSSDKAKVAWGNLKEQIGTALLPVLDRLAAFFTTTIAPAISTFVTNLSSGKGAVGEFGRFVTESVVPAIKKLGDFLGTYVIPVLRDLAGFIINKVVPAVRDYLSRVLDGARDAFDKIRTAVKENEPQLRQLLNAFKKVAVFILEKVMPVLGTIVGFLYDNLGTAIAAAIGYIGDLVDGFNQTRAAVAKARDFISNAVDKIVSFFKKLPGRITGAFGNAGALLKSIGGQIIDGLVNGIKAAAGKVADAVQAIVNKIPKKIREIMGISSPSKVTTDLGRMIGEGLARGIDSTAEKVSKATQKLIDKLKSQLDSVKSDFASLKDSVAGAFTSNLFEAETASGFISNLLDTKGTLTALKAAFTKLAGWGLRPEFLSQLFQSGNGGLILDLAAGSKDQATQAASLFGDVGALSSSLGTSVADVKFGDKLDGIRDEIRALRKDNQGNADRTGQAVGREINGAARNGRRLARV